MRLNLSRLSILAAGTAWRTTCPDQLLVEVAKRLQRVTRDTDTVARLGGDEFVVLLEGLGPHAVTAAEYAALAADKIRTSLIEEYVLDEIRHHGSASIGVTLFFGDEADSDQLIKDADAAMYEVKRGCKQKSQQISGGERIFQS